MSGQDWRLPAGGNVLDRSRRLSFRFDGRSYTGYAGDTLASALLASGRHMVARSFKYHRPRGIFGAGAEDPAALVQLNPDGAYTEPNTSATEQELYAGLEAKAQNCWPSLNLDLAAVNDAVSFLLPAGFYYKTFMGPPGNWMRFEGAIRRMAGLGVAPAAPDPERYEHTNRHCEVLVIGGGPAGLVAALAAARGGARVIVAEETPHLGGRLRSLPADAVDLDGQPAGDWVAAIRAELERQPEVTILTRTTAFGYYGENFVGLWQKLTDHLAPGERPAALPRQRLWRVRAAQVVLATGAIERPPVFHQNDRPGVMLAGAVRSYLHRQAVVPGRRPLVFAANDAAWATAFELQDAGAEVMGIADLRRQPPAALLAAAAERGIPIFPAHAVVGTSGRRRIDGADLRALDDADGTHGPRRSVACDLLAVSAGFVPNVALFAQSRGRLRYDPSIAAFRPGQSWQRERSVGAANGEFELAAALQSAAEAGAAAARAAGFDTAPLPAPQVTTDHTAGMTGMALWEAPGDRPRHRRRAFVDLHNDVTTKDLHLAVGEGYRSVEHVKRYTTAGMGTDQGKTAGLNIFATIAGAMDQSIPQTGTTTYRPPYKPVTFGAIAGQHVGRLFQPRRTTPMHGWHVARGAEFEPVGDWLRARAYPRTGESLDAAVQRESKAARSAIGVLDASTLGKIDIRGTDARTFLNRVYTNAWSKLAPGRCRYGIMLGEDGMVKDDGVTACLADDHFHMTTTTGGAAHILAWLEEYRQTEWPELDVRLTSVTEQWAVVALCGPQSAGLVANLVDGLPDAPEALPFMTWHQASVDGVPIRLFRISFTGEMSFELNVPASYGLWLWEKVFAAGESAGITPYGTDAMHLLRAEKGFIIVGQDTDGTVTPIDLRMDWIVSQKKGEFIGKRSLSREDTVRSDRPQLVGLLTEDPKEVLAEGAHVIATGTEPAPPVPMLGHVTSSYFSPNLNRSIALALVEAGGDRLGERLYVTRPGQAPAAVTVGETDFLAAAEAPGDA